ncbi:DNA mismatch repair endonuclease MutL [Candidatus Woesearchaeota archaeon]|nr:DNA mismatch repair endonuclease MutL [Candidatus Woesearchaeota archaeon]
MSIQLLSEDVINKIAAGEVIERPASVVKELIENSLDAAATKITVDIEDYGKKLIRITDNGQGMNEDDARKALLRHATSKISSAEDLFFIATLGFRGEALASIAAISRFSLTTKQPEALAGFNFLAEGGQITSSGIAPAEQGTTIEIRDLFYNTPPRRKFLKTDGVELRHIIDVTTHYALLNPAVAFRLTHNHQELVLSPATSDLRSNLASLYGVETAKELLELRAEETGMSLQGFVGKPYHARNDNHQQTLFVNGRWIKNNDLVKAVYTGYHSLLFVNRHPVFVLHLRLDPSQIDVNVHPQKSEIRIEQKEKVGHFITRVVQRCLQEHTLLPTLSLTLNEEQGISSAGSKPKYAYEPSTQTVLTVKEADAVSYVSDQLTSSSESLASSFSSSLPQTASAQPERLTTHFPELRLLGQIHKTFFVAETAGGVFFIDQHAAHERVMYEQLMTQLTSGHIENQAFLTGEMMDLTAAEIVLCQEYKDQLEEMGFTIEEFGGNSYLLKTAPAVFGRQQVKDLFGEILHTFGENHSRRDQNKVEELRETIITRLACRAAVMAGEELTVQRMGKILEQLRETEFPYTCPHGRPTLLKTTADELEKKFRRK